MPSAPSTTARTGFNRLLLACFLALLWAPTLDNFFALDHSRQPPENRLPVPVPRLESQNFSGLQKFIAGSELYFNDHFGFRNKLIRWFQNWKGGLFHDRTTDKVINGQNGWLFMSELKMIEHHLGIAKFTPAQLKSWQALLEKRRDWLAARGIKYLLVVPPDKQEIYPEFLPTWLLAATPTNRENKLDQFFRFMRVNSTVEVLDLRQTVSAAKQTAPTYLQNDSHWNGFGSLVAAQQVVKVLSRQFPGLPPLRLEDFHWMNAPTTGGDLVQMLGTESPEKNYFTVERNVSAGDRLTFSTNNIASRLDPHGSATVSESGLHIDTSAVVFGDSFSGRWKPFLGYSFRRIFYSPGGNREFDPQIIVQNQPQIVINEILQRYLNTYDPLELMASDKLP